MNKQELIEGIEAVPAHNTRTRPWIDKKMVLGLVRQLDEPEKVVVPQFVADLFEFAKLNDWDLEDIFEDVRNESRGAEISKWFYQKKNIDILARAWLDGYEVEKEPKYIVKFKGFNPRYIILKYQPYDKTWFLGGEQEYEFYRTEHTRKKLEEADFGWVFNCEGIEVEEVKE